MIRPGALAAVLVTAACTAPTAPHSLPGVVPGVPGTASPAVTLSAPPSPQCRVIDGRADRRCTPGALNPGVSQANVHGTICVPGYTNTIRPPSSYTTALKHQQKILYGETGLTDTQVTEDHLISLSAGGAPTDPLNLFPQPVADARRKDLLENQVRRDVCAGRITLKQGQDQLLNTWSHP